SLHKYGTRFRPLKHCPSSRNESHQWRKLLDWSRGAGEKGREALEKAGLFENVKFAAAAVLRTGAVAIKGALLFTSPKMQNFFAGSRDTPIFAWLALRPGPPLRLMVFPWPGAGGGNLNFAWLAQS